MDTRIMQALAVSRGIEFYLKTGMQVNRAYTPKAMRETASSLTGKTYKRTELAQAASDLREWIEAKKGE